MKVSVIGSGVMGPGIAQVFMMGGHRASLTDVSEKALRDGESRIRGNLNLMHNIGIIEKSRVYVGGGFSGRRMFRRLTIRLLATEPMECRQGCRTQPEPE